MLYFSPLHVAVCGFDPIWHGPVFGDDVVAPSTLTTVNAAIANVIIPTNLL